jgi:hypothetical protein
MYDGGCELADRIASLFGFSIHADAYDELSEAIATLQKEHGEALALLARARDCGVDDDWHVAVGEFLEEVGE